MNAALLAIRLIISAVLAVSGAAKLADPKGSQEALDGFGVPEWLAAPSAWLLPLYELAVAIALIPLMWAPWGAWGALGLFCLFAIAIVVTMARGKSPDCHCFGRLHSEPVGPSTLVRNLVLGSCSAALIRFGPGASAGGWLSDLNTAETALLVLLMLGLGMMALLVAVLFQMMKQNGRILTRLDELEAGGTKKAAEPAPPAGLPPGSDAPSFDLESIAGGTVSLADLLEPAQRLLLVFGDPNCGPCASLMPEVSRWDEQAKPHFSVVLISRGTAEMNREKLAKTPIGSVLLQKDREVAAAYKADATPTAVILEPDGTVGTPVAVGPDAIRALVSRIINASLVNIGLKQGDVAPEFSLPEVNGKVVPSSEFRGKWTMLVFWNPSCGFCQRMLPDLKRWENKRSKNDAQVVLISTGSVADNSGFGLRAPVLLDDTSTIMKLFNCSGTPTGVLLDPTGRLSSEPAVGAVALFDLVASRPKLAEPVAG